MQTCFVTSLAGAPLVQLYERALLILAFCVHAACHIKQAARPDIQKGEAAVATEANQLGRPPTRAKAAR